MTTRWRWCWRVLGVLLVAALAFAGYGVWQVRSMGFLRSPVFETERPQLPPLQHPAVLVFSKTNSFIHKEAIPAAKQLLQQMAGEQGWRRKSRASGVWRSSTSSTR